MFCCFFCEWRQAIAFGLPWTSSRRCLLIAKHASCNVRDIYKVWLLIGKHGFKEEIGDKTIRVMSSGVPSENREFTYSDVSKTSENRCK